MFSGFLTRYINCDFLSTHHILNSIAYSKIFRFRKKKRFFPELSLIQDYSGLKGPDGLWLQKKSFASEHAYNPDLNEGDALCEISKQYDLFLNFNKDQNSKGAAKSAAYLSHYIVDVLDPAHHIGHRKSLSIGDNWHDPHYRETVSLIRNLAGRHFFFEMCSAYYLFMKKQLYLHRKLKVRHRRTKSQLIKSLCRRVHYIHRLHIYDNFFNKKDQIYAKKNIMKVMFPLMISSIGQFWWSARQNSKPRAFRNNFIRLRKKTSLLPFDL